MAELDADDRERLRRDQFAYVDREGEGHLPIHDESHVRNASSRFDQTEFESKVARERARKRILEAARKYDIEVNEGSSVAHAVRWVATEHGAVPRRHPLTRMRPGK